MIQQCIKLSVDHFPFKASLSLVPLIDIRQREKTNNLLLANMAELLNSRLEQAPELMQPIIDETILKKHQPLVDMLMNTLLPSAKQDQEMIGAFAPFEKDCFYSTPLFDVKLLKGTHQIQYPAELEEKLILYHRIYYAYILILKKFYNRVIYEQKTLPFVYQDEQGGLKNHYKICINTEFVDVKNVGELPVLTPDELKYLLHNFHDLDIWMQYIPPQHFQLEGFVILSLLDITEGEILSAIKLSLLDSGSLTTPEKFDRLQSHLQRLLQKENVRLGISAFQKSGNSYIKFGRKITRSFISKAISGVTCPASVADFYEKLVTKGNPLFIEDIAHSMLNKQMKDALIDQNIASIVCLPLYFEDEIIGVLELAFPSPTDLTDMVFSRIEEVLPLFALTLKWNIDQEESQIDAIIKEKFTAIHPSVEWRFKQAAINLLEKQAKGETIEIEPIIFPQVYPLYAACDIRNSSVERNRAIGKDLVKQLQLAKAALDEIFLQYPFPIYAKLLHSINKHIKSIRNGLLSDAESNIQAFLQKEIEPVFRHIGQANIQLQDQLQLYWNSLDKELGVVYEKRKDFEESLMLINDTLSMYLEKEERNAQKMFPHYYEKYKTDGIEYTIYVGASLVQGMEYTSIYLKNLRLWQLITLCDMARQTKSLQPHLKIPLETTGLILVHSVPLSIRFRMDERHFDVDGAYNIRYEILKKRIDKALIKGNGERLTQPGKIVIIYSRLQEANEYAEYIEYLQEKGMLTDIVENLDLEDLQGVQGLKALRIEVKLKENELTQKKPTSVVTS